ncbi:hypothetical protein BDV96DRAFT_567297 [Lophiotrema nucula]|uniref:Uncharacterized protein n=1 Tax=Lophiotrema nucula TaxID=690887 RepID=A0A6A5ZLE7_9PLEO|nr:hypothetical protein BDV96DRAFT_567297 [Lophiotrema nucula]
MRDSPSYEPLDQGQTPGHYEVQQQDIDTSYHSFLEKQTPVTNVKPLSAPSSVSGARVDEEPKVALNKSIFPLLLSFLIHLVPAASTIAIVQLSFYRVFWFDNDSSTNTVPFKRGPKLSLNELLNSLQFVAKIHEILLVGSLSAMVMHRVRNRLMGRHGLPFGLLTAGYSVGSAEYLFSGAFRSGFNRRFWLLSILIIAFTLLANTLGPASAIALVPNLDWWPMRKPFGSESLPVVFSLPQKDWWPLEINANHMLLSDGNGGTEAAETCYSSTAFHETGCPASGWDAMQKWAIANANEAIPANVSMEDGLSPTQRIVKSRLSPRHDNIPGVAFTTSLSHSFTTIMGSFWELVRSEDYPVSDVIRPMLEPLKNQTIYQPLVQVQCLPNLLETITELQERNRSVGDNFDLNTFSTRNASRLPVPEYLFGYKYDPPHTVFTDALGRPTVNQHEAFNLTWMDYSEVEGYNLSLAAIVTTPMNIFLHSNDTERTQTAILHFCSVDARWIGSKPSYDPAEHRVMATNVSDPLIFQRPKNADDRKYKSNMEKWGVSPALKLDTEWANALNIKGDVDNRTGDIFQWLLSPYILQEFDDSKNLTGQRINYTFNPGFNSLENATFATDINNYMLIASETVATILGMMLTDGLARVQLTMAQQGDVITKHVNDTTVTASWIAGFSGLSAVGGTRNVSAAEVALLPTSYTFQVSRYGYGYGFTTATVYFGAAVLLSHTLLTVIYIVYALYDYLFVTRWTSSAWGGVGELIALLINSKPTTELQNTCAGIDSKHTWRKRVWIREVEPEHLSVVVGEQDLAPYQKVRVGISYGTLDEKTGSAGVRRRRGSV